MASAVAYRVLTFATLGLVASCARPDDPASALSPDLFVREPIKDLTAAFLLNYSTQERYEYAVQFGIPAMRNPAPDKAQNAARWVWIIAESLKTASPSDHQDLVGKWERALDAMHERLGIRPPLDDRNRPRPDDLRYQPR